MQVGRRREQFGEKQTLAAEARWQALWQKMVDVVRREKFVQGRDVSCQRPRRRISSRAPCSR